MKLFQIEEPDGGPDADAPGAAVGIDLTRGTVAFAVGGNAELLATEPGADLAVLKGAAEKALARPVTHAVVVAAAAEDAARAAQAAGVALLRTLASAEADALAAAALAEDLAPRIV